MNTDTLRRAITFLSEYRSVAPDEKKDEILNVTNELILYYNLIKRSDEKWIKIK